MAVFSTNQNRQFFVATTTKNVTPTNVGDLQTVYVDNGDCNPYFYLIQMAKGGLNRTDIVESKQVMWYTLTAPTAMAKKLKTATITLSNKVNSGAPVECEDYILRVNFRQMYGMSDEDIYQKYGAVHTYKGMTAAQFYQEMAYSLFKNFNRLYSPLLSIKIANKVIASASKVNGTITFKDDTGATINAASASNIVITELPQTKEWKRGIAKLEPVYFEVIPTYVYEGVDAQIWGDVVYGVDANTTIGNGYDIADLEWFCMGERADQYRGKGYPDNLTTDYMVDETQQYYVLDIHYAYQGTCDDIQKSEKTLTIVSTTKAVLDAIVSAAKLKPEQEAQQQPAG